MPALYKGLFVAGGIAAIAFYPVTTQIMEAVGGVSGINYYVAALLGLAVTLALVFITDYYTSKSYAPVKYISKASETGHATNIIAGLAVGMQSTAAPVVVIAAAILGSFWICGGAEGGGLYGVAVAAESGREMSISSGDGGIAVREFEVGGGFEDRFQHADGPLALGERRVQRGRGEPQQVRRAVVGDHAPRPQCPGEPAGVRVRRLAQHHAVEHAEERGRRAHPEGEREDRGEGVAGSVSELAEGEPEIAHGAAW